MTSRITISIPSAETFLAVQFLSIQLDALADVIKEIKNPEWNRLYPELSFFSREIEKLAQKNIEPIKKIVANLQKKVRTSHALLERRCVEELFNREIIILGLDKSSTIKNAQAIYKDVSTKFFESRSENNQTSDQQLGLYPNNLKNWEFDKEASQNFCLKRMTIAERQGMSEDKNFAAKPTPSKTNFSSCLGIYSSSSPSSSSCSSISYSTLPNELQHTFKLFDHLNELGHLADIALSSELQHPNKLVHQLKTLEGLAHAISPETLQDTLLKVNSLDAVIDFNGVYMSISNRIYSLNGSTTPISASRLKQILAYVFEESVILGMISCINLKGIEYAETAFDDFFYPLDGSSTSLGKAFFNYKCKCLKSSLHTKAGKKPPVAILKKEIALKALEVMSNTLKSKKSFDSPVL